MLKGFAVAATAGMFIVLLMGALVTNTGSGEGCGKSWPLCHGQFIPEYAFETMVEYSHRLVTGIEGLLIAGLSLGAWLSRRRLPEMKWLVPLMIVTLLLQSGMGAWAVMYPQTPPVMALHFGISLVCLASVFLTLRVIFEGDARPLDHAPPPPGGFRGLALVTLAAIVGVAYLGAFMRHSGTELACHTWPLCNGELFPGLSGAVGVAFGHRLGALAATGLVVWLVVWAGRLRPARPDLARITTIGLGLILIQSLIGGVVIISRLTFASTILHAAVMALLFITVAELCRRVLPPAAAAAPRPAPSATPALSAKA
ncbi:MAG: heme A synthase [Chloroflexota bacterium]|nr:heme A synthase [Chloroflexota bacterium]